MVVYSVVLSVDYEGLEFRGVFASREDAVAYVESQDDDYGQFGVVVSELGQPLDVFQFDSAVEWL